MAGPSASVQAKFRSLRRGSRPTRSVVEHSKNDSVFLDSDWIDITHADVPIKLDDPVHPSLTLNTSVTSDRADNRSISESLTLTLRPDPSEPPYHHPQHVRSRSSLGIWKNLSKVSLQSPQSLTHRFSKALRRNSRKGDTHSILDEFPAPPSHLPTPVTPLSAGQPVSYTWPFKDNSDSRTLALSNASTSPTKSNGNPLKSLAKVFSLASRQRNPAEVPVTPVHSKDQSQHKVVDLLEPLTEVPDEETPAGVVSEASSDPTNTVSYEFVDPRQLCCEPSPLIGQDPFNTAYNSSARSSFVPPSPSWLSRNVPQLIIPDSDSQATPQGESEGPITPASPAPLPIPPRIFISTCPSIPNTPPLSPLEVTDCWLKHLDTAVQSRYSRISNCSNLSRKSSAASVHGLFSSTDHRSDSKASTRIVIILITCSSSISNTEHSPHASSSPVLT
ncbi:hypothetical protein L218DRAFT_6596 [Marasmius fiardii PR-910]|nr:hypothetical protein L218DRAFT_6596 [Marasmius fiardii PR-910]